MLGALDAARQGTVGQDLQSPSGHIATCCGSELPQTGSLRRGRPTPQQRLTGAPVYSSPLIAYACSVPGPVPDARKLARATDNHLLRDLTPAPPPVAVALDAAQKQPPEGDGERLVHTEGLRALSQPPQSFPCAPGALASTQSRCSLKRQGQP